jgi:hypothetical protein
MRFLLPRRLRRQATKMPCSLGANRLLADERLYGYSVVRFFHGDREVAEVFFLATEGLHSDLLSTKVLRKRLQILVDHFARD